MARSVMAGVEVAALAHRLKPYWSHTAVSCRVMFIVSWAITWDLVSPDGPDNEGERWKHVNAGWMKEAYERRVKEACECWIDEKKRVNVGLMKRAFESWVKAVCDYRVNEGSM